MKRYGSTSASKAPKQSTMTRTASLTFRRESVRQRLNISNSPPLQTFEEENEVVERFQPLSETMVMRVEDETQRSRSKMNTTVALKSISKKIKEKEKESKNLFPKIEEFQFQEDNEPQSTNGCMSILKCLCCL